MLLGTSPLKVQCLYDKILHLEFLVCIFSTPKPIMYTLLFLETSPPNIIMEMVDIGGCQIVLD